MWKKSRRRLQSRGFRGGLITFLARYSCLSTCWRRKTMRTFYVDPLHFIYVNGVGMGKMYRAVPISDVDCGLEIPAVGLMMIERWSYG